MNEIYQQEAICALATPSGVGAIAVIRISGEQTFSIVNQIFKGKDLTKVDTHTVHFGTIRENNVIVDEVLAAVFKGPKSFTKEDTVEISCHGSDYIIRQIIKLLVRHGARLARPGEFTQRAFLNGQFDLVQAEAVADLIAADSAASHRTALNQLRGGFSKKLASLREELIHFASMVELELDFGEEDVEFANRDDLKTLIINLQSTIGPLIESFDFGNALKEGVPVAIIGAPNVGKSTLLNALLNEEKAIVTAIAGTTRDVIEDLLYIDGIKFRIIDTAGIRETEDVVESMGIKRSMRAMEQADVVLMLFDSEETLTEVEKLAEGLEKKKKVIWVRNKADLTSPNPLLSGEGFLLPSPERRGVGGGPPRGEVKSKAQALIDNEYKPMYYKIPPPVLENARKLRGIQTSAEEFLWQILRNRQLNGLKFRRQHPVQEGFILDFYCAEHRLGIELDGGVHSTAEQTTYDELRTQELKSIYGISIIRFRNEEVFENVEAILERIITITSPNPRIVVDIKSPSTEKRAVEDGLPRNEIAISAKTGEGIETLKKTLTSSLLAADSASDTVITNLRHYEHLVKTQQALTDALNGLEIGITGDFLAQDIRLALHHLGEITGQIVNDDLLANIFSKFCIGK